MSGPVYGDQFATLRAEVERLRQSLATVADAHERDLMRLARALGFDHEPPASVDEVVERAKALRVESLKAHTTAERLTREAAGYEEQLREARTENAQLTAERDALTRGEDTPSLDAIRAHGGVWVVTDGSTATKLSLRVDAATVYAFAACGCDLRYDMGRFAEMQERCRWWRVRGEGTLAVGESRGPK